MSIRRRSLATAAALAVVVLVVCSAPLRALAVTELSGPSVALDRDEVSPGDHVAVTIDGFAANSVTISVCGNEARRGSADCNMTASEGLRLDADGTSTLTQIPVGEPPVTCPCVIRVSTRTSDEIAVAPIVITGHPVGPVVDAATLLDPLQVTVSAEEAPDGLFAGLRSGLGGPTTYEVSVTVRNTSTVPLNNVRIAGSVGRNPDENLATLDLVDPGAIGAGQTWKATVTAVLPAPSFNRVQWRVAVSGAGPTVNAAASTRHRPMLLIVLVMLLVLDLALIALRFAVRRRVARALVYESSLASLTT